jgi:hypothetical protein
MAILETFREVRTGFRQLWSDLDGGRLDLEIVCPGSFDSRNPPDTFRPDDVIGHICVPLNKDLSRFSPWPEPIQIDANWVQPAQIETFVDLCGNAGSLLPSKRKHELRWYCNWDSRRPEELWIAHLLCLTEQYTSGRPNDDVIHIRHPVRFSVDVITDWMDAGYFPNESPPPESAERIRHAASESPCADFRRYGKSDETPIGPITGTITALGYALHSEGGLTEKAYQNHFWTLVVKKKVWAQHSPSSSGKTDMFLRASSTTKSDKDFSDVQRITEKVNHFESQPKRNSSRRK